MTNHSEINKGRNVVYNFLSKSLLDIPDSRYMGMFEDLHRYLLELLSNSENEDMKTAGETIKIFRKKNILQEDKSQDEVILDLSKEYTRLFYLGIHSVPICESVYLSPVKTNMQEQWEEVKKTYAENNFTPENKGNKPEDHISFELLFMSFLSQKASTAAEQNDGNELTHIYQKQQAFMEEHLLKWIDDLCERILSVSDKESSLYAGIALFLRGYLHEDYKFLSDMTL